MRVQRTLVSMNLDIKVREEELAKVEETDIDVSAT